jgi:hypothetical protein
MAPVWSARRRWQLVAGHYSDVSATPVATIRKSTTRTEGLPDCFTERAGQVGQLRLEGEHLEPIRQRPAGFRRQRAHRPALVASQRSA